MRVLITRANGFLGSHPVDLPIESGDVDVRTELLPAYISKARRVLGYRPEYYLDTGVRDTIDWCRKHGLLWRKARE